MANAILKIKIMPESIETNLKNLLKNLKTKIKEVGGILADSEEQEIAFGLKTLIITIMWPEEKDTSIIEDVLKSIKGVSNIDILDYRREFG